LADDRQQVGDEQVRAGDAQVVGPRLSGALGDGKELEVGRAGAAVAEELRRPALREDRKLQEVGGALGGRQHGDQRVERAVAQIVGVRREDHVARGVRDERVEVDDRRGDAARHAIGRAAGAADHDGVGLDVDVEAG
jgi:hypothetical protein